MAEKIVTETHFGLPQLKKNQKYIFFKLPKNFDINLIENISLKLPKNEENTDFKIDSEEYRLRLDDPHTFSNLRPLISTESGAKIGEPFAASYTLTRHITVNNTPQTRPITFYDKVPQLEGLTVRHMPFGSTTNIEDLRARRSIKNKADSSISEGLSSLGEGEEKGEERIEKKDKSSKRRKSEARESISETPTETPGKHSKKSKKNKKE